MEFQVLWDRNPGFSSRTVLTAIELSSFGKKPYTLDVDYFDKEIFTQLIDLYCCLLRCPNSVSFNVAHTNNRKTFYKELEMSAQLLTILQKHIGVVHEKDLNSITVELINGSTVLADKLKEEDYGKITGAGWCSSDDKPASSLSEGQSQLDGGSVRRGEGVEFSGGAGAVPPTNGDKPSELENKETEGRVDSQTDSSNEESIEASGDTSKRTLI